MRYRFILTRDDGRNKLIIQEFSRRPDDTSDPLGVREYDSPAVEAALAAGPVALAEVIRSERMYPPSTSMAVLAEGIGRLYGPERGELGELEVEELDVTPAEVVRRVEEVEEVKEDLLDDEEEEEEFPEEEILDEEEDFGSGKILKVEDADSVEEEEIEE